MAKKRVSFGYGRPVSTGTKGHSILKQSRYSVRRATDPVILSYSVRRATDPVYLPDKELIVVSAPRRPKAYDYEAEFEDSINAKKAALRLRTAIRSDPLLTTTKYHDRNIVDVIQQRLDSILLEPVVLRPVRETPIRRRHTFTSLATPVETPFRRRHTFTALATPVETRFRRRHTFTSLATPLHVAALTKPRRKVDPIIDLSSFVDTSYISPITQAIIGRSDLMFAQTRTLEPRVSRRLQEAFAELEDDIDFRPRRLGKVKPSVVPKVVNDDVFVLPPPRKLLRSTPKPLSAKILRGDPFEFEWNERPTSYVPLSNTLKWLKSKSARSLSVPFFTTERFSPVVNRSPSLLPKLVARTPLQRLTSFIPIRYVVIQSSATVPRSKLSQRSRQVTRKLPRISPIQEKSTKKWMPSLYRTGYANSAYRAAANIPHNRVSRSASLPPSYGSDNYISKTRAKIRDVISHHRHDPGYFTTYSY